MALFSYLLILLFGLAAWVSYRALPKASAHIASLVACSGALIGVGLVSLWHYATLLVIGHLSVLGVIVGDGLLSLLLSIYIYARRPAHMFEVLKGDMLAVWKSDDGAPQRGRMVILGLMFLAGILIVWWMWIMPRTQWDIWITWEQHARFVTRDEGRQWRELFVAARAGDGWFRHTDYPFLWPLAISRAWIYAGGESVWSAWGLIMLVVVTTTYAVMAVAKECAARTQSTIVAGLLLLTQPIYFYWATTRYGEGPLSAYMLLAAVFLLLAHFAKDASRRALFIALFSLAAGCGAWTKNEGIMFLVPLALAAMMSRLSKKELILAACSISPFLIALLVHKTYVAPPGDLTLSVLVQNIPQLFMPQRYFHIGQYLLKHGAISMLGIVSILLIYQSAASFSRKYWILYLVLVLQFGGYMLTYLLTPHALQWHLPTSFERVWMQLWPIVSLTIALSFDGQGKRTTE